MKIIKSFLSAASIVLMVACAQLGALTPQTFNERLAVGYVAVKEIRASAARLLTSGAITRNDGQQVLISTDAARQGLDVADQLYRINAEAGDAKLQSTVALLGTLREYVAAKEKAK